MNPPVSSLVVVTVAILLNVSTSVAEPCPSDADAVGFVTAFPAVRYVSSPNVSGDPIIIVGTIMLLNANCCFFSVFVLKS